MNGSILKELLKKHKITASELGIYMGKKPGSARQYVTTSLYPQKDFRTDTVNTIVAFFQQKGISVQDSFTVNEPQQPYKTNSKAHEQSTAQPPGTNEKDNPINDPKNLNMTTSEKQRLYKAIEDLAATSRIHAEAHWKDSDNMARLITIIERYDDAGMGKLKAG